MIINIKAFNYLDTLPVLVLGHRVYYNDKDDDVRILNTKPELPFQLIIAHERDFGKKFGRRN